MHRMGGAWAEPGTFRGSVNKDHSQSSSPPPPPPRPVRRHRCDTTVRIAGVAALVDPANGLNDGVTLAISVPISAPGSQQPVCLPATVTLSCGQVRHLFSLTSDTRTCGTSFSESDRQGSHASQPREPVQSDLPPPGNSPVFMAFQLQLAASQLGQSPDIAHQGTGLTAASAAHVWTDGIPMLARPFPQRRTQGLPSFSISAVLLYYAISRFKLDVYFLQSCFLSGFALN